MAVSIGIASEITRYIGWQQIEEQLRRGADSPSVPWILRISEGLNGPAGFFAGAPLLYFVATTLFWWWLLDWISHLRSLAGHRMKTWVTWLFTLTSVALSGICILGFVFDLGSYRFFHLNWFDRDFWEYARLVRAYFFLGWFVFLFGSAIFMTARETRRALVMVKSNR